MAVNTISKEFLNVTLFPKLGQRSVTITWATVPSIADGAFYVYRSMDGVSNWRLLNDTPVYNTFYEDTTIEVKNRTIVPHYRVLCEKDGESYDSAIIGLYNTLTRSQLGIVNRIKMEELRKLRGSNGMPMFLYPQLLGGVPCKFVDRETGDHYGHGCKNTDEDCYGTGLVGGFSKPLLIWGALMGDAMTSGTYAVDGSGETDYGVASFRLLTTVIPQVGDLLVLPDVDGRYLIGEGSITLKFKGVYPVVTEAKATLLQHNHDFYRVPVPVDSTLPHGRY